MDRHNVGECRSGQKNKNWTDKMINDKRREFYSTKKMGSLYVQRKQKLSSAPFFPSWDRK